MKTTRLNVSTIALALAATALAGCSSIGKLYEPDPQPALIQPVAPQAKVAWASSTATDGSIWTDAHQGLFGDDKAARPGDTVLVRVVQRNTGTKNANTATERDSSISGKIKYFFGLEDEVNKLTSGRGETASATGGWDPTNLVESSSSSAFEGTGETNRTDTLTATVSAIVTDRLPNGNLTIYGHQTVMINNEASVLTLQGIIRPSDIGTDNSIDSSRIANADIRFTGSGVISDKQHPGWGMRAFDWVWPF
jgi:flagellar L-ring protein precursor FlgH